MDLQHPELNQRHQPVDIADRHILLIAAAFPEADRPDRAGHAGAQMLLIETDFVLAIGAANDRQRPFKDMGQQMVGDIDVVARHVLFGEAAIRIDHARWMREPDAAQFPRLLHRCHSYLRGPRPAISLSERPVLTLRSFRFSKRSPSPGRSAESWLLISNQLARFSRRESRIRTRCHSPFSFLPDRRKCNRPLMSMR